MTEATPADRVTIVLRPLGTPLPLGFVALAIGTLAFSALQLGWVAPADSRAVAITALMFTAPLQLIASLLGFLARDAVAGTGMGVLSGTWAVAGTVTLTSPPGASSRGLGVVLLGAALGLLVPAAGASGKPVAAAVLATAAVRFAVTGAAHLSGSPGWETAAGWTGLVLAGLALYAATAFELEAVRQRSVPPLLRRDDTGNDVARSVTSQPPHLSAEPGIRPQL